MLADAYKIASDIKEAKPDLRFLNLLLDKSKLKAYCLSLKMPLISICDRFDTYTANESSSRMTSVSEYLLKMITYVDVMIDNSDVYFDDGSKFYSILRRTSPRKAAIAYDDIENIHEAAVDCINIIEMSNIHK